MPRILISKHHYPFSFVLAVVVGILGSACSAGIPATRPGAIVSHAHPSRGDQCLVAPDDLPTAADFPTFTRFVAVPHASLPVTYFALTKPQFVREYVCGEFYGFITNVALTGTYRQENTRYFEQYGYQPGKWPYVPLRGQIVTDLRHQVLEVYESIYQFTTPQAAGIFLSRSVSPAYPEHRILVSLAPGAVVTSTLLGPDPATNEHVIHITVPRGIYAIELSIQGGQSLEWEDAQGYWEKLAGLIPALKG